MFQRWRIGLLCLLLAGSLTGCAADAEAPAAPETPLTVAPNGAVAWSRSRFDGDANDSPVVRVYRTDTREVERMDVETYLQGVLAGEMKNDWPLEALKAQAILARTYVVKFVSEKKSQYAGAHISTDIEEAQAYDASAVNERIRQAVEETRGMVMVSGGMLPYGWFHAHSGGMTALAKEGLGWAGAEPAYTRVTQGNEPSAAQAAEQDEGYQEAAAWEATFPFEEVAAACRKLGARVALNKNSSVAVGERGQSGRAVTLRINGESVPAAELRLQLGSTKMRSTLLTSCKVTEDGVYMSGKGYGHGVGMSQWGAYAMAKNGSTAREIVQYYYDGVSLALLWE